MNKQVLKVNKREVKGRKVSKLRKSGLVPANVYGSKVSSLSVQVEEISLKKVYEASGESTLVYLQVDGEKEERPVMIRQIDIHPVDGKFLHVQFQQVNLKEKIVAQVKINLVGESLAEKDGKGILVQQLAEIEVEALPTDLPEHIDVNVESLTEVDMAVMVKDLKIDSKLTVKTDPETIVVKIDVLAKEEKVEAPVAPTTPEATAEGESKAEAETENQAEKSN